MNAAWLLTAALCTYAVGYRFHSRFIATRIFALDAARPTPSVRLNDGRDYVPTNRWIVFGHHFAAIAGPGPLVGPTLAAQFGFLPGAIWIIVGVVFGGAVQDFVILASSVRLIRGPFDVLMEATPEGVDADAVARAMGEVPGVHGVHELHVWSVTPGFDALQDLFDLLR